MFNLENKQIIITGASKGLGSVCATALSKQGACLALMARTESSLQEVINSCQFPEKHIAISLDLTDMNQLRNSFKKAKDFLGSIDVVLHVVGGGLGLRDPLLDSGGLEKLFKLNIGIATEINSLAAPDMIKRGRGNLVHVGSIASSEATGSVGYNTVKAALAAYVRSLGRELADSGVIVTGVLPGGFSAPGNAMTRLKKAKPDVYDKFVEERLPRKFMGKAEEIIPMIILLCSDSASMMGGCLVPIDAGEGTAYLID
jgi:3-oxoacyl-[acyl-carrier protein] reductase|tara:strand:- start:330 stop:1100 length:771 start_codon:yes stop_codon:yes gene_type:complete